MSLRFLFFNIFLLFFIISIDLFSSSNSFLYRFHLLLIHKMSFFFFEFWLLRILVLKFLFDFFLYFLFHCWDIIFFHLFQVCLWLLVGAFYNSCYKVLARWFWYVCCGDEVCWLPFLWSLRFFSSFAYPAIWMDFEHYEYYIIKLSLV